MNWVLILNSFLFLLTKQKSALYHHNLPTARDVLFPCRNPFLPVAPVNHVLCWWHVESLCQETGEAHGWGLESHRGSFLRGRNALHCSGCPLHRCGHLSPNCALRSVHLLCTYSSILKNKNRKQTSLPNPAHRKLSLAERFIRRQTWSLGQLGWAG